MEHLLRAEPLGSVTEFGGTRYTLGWAGSLGRCRKENWLIDLQVICVLSRGVGAQSRRGGYSRARAEKEPERENCSFLISLTLYSNTSKFCLSRRTECKRNVLFPSWSSSFSARTVFVTLMGWERIFFQLKTVVYLLRRVEIHTTESLKGKTCSPLSQCLLLRLLLPWILLLFATRQIILYSFYKPVHVKFVQVTLLSTYLWTVCYLRLIPILHALKNNHWSRWFTSLGHQPCSLYQYLVTVKFDPCSFWRCICLPCFWI